MGCKQDAYEYLKNAIITNELPPGSPVRENEISAALGMSRTPIREALRDLEADGLVVSYPFRGTFVSDITPYDIEEIFELRILMETWAMKRSVNRITNEELDQVEQAFCTGDDWERIHKADRMLHGLIVQRSGSTRVIGFIATLQAQLDRLRTMGHDAPDRKKRSFQEHMDIIAAIRERDCEKSCQALEKHLRSVAKDAMEVASYLHTAGRVG